MYSREEVLKQFDVENSIIRSPGKYGGEGIELPRFHDYALNGFGTTVYLDSETVDYFEIREDDIQEFPELEEYDYYFVQYSNRGFVYGEPMTEEEILDSPHEEIRAIAK